MPKTVNSKASTRNPFFYLLMIALTATATALAILAVSALTGLNPNGGKSNYERELAKTGYEILKFRARKPYVMFRPMPNIGQINSLGYRSPELPVIKGENELRIAMLGGSVVFGAARDTSIVARLAQRLQEAPELEDREITYINAGVPSAVSGQELASFIYELVDLEIDLIIVLDGFNDFYSAIHYDPRPGYPYDFIVEEYRYYRFEKGTWRTLLYHFFQDRFVNLRPKAIVGDYFEALGMERPRFEDAKDRVVDAYIENVSKISRIAGAHGIKAAVFLQPYSPQHNQRDGADGTRIMQLFNMASERFQELAQENSADRVFYDLTPLSYEMKDLFVDVVHFKPEGNEILTRKIHSILKQAGMLV